MGRPSAHLAPAADIRRVPAAECPTRRGNASRHVQLLPARACLTGMGGIAKHLVHELLHQLGDELCSDIRRPSIQPMPLRLRGYAYVSDTGPGIRRRRAGRRFRYRGDDGASVTDPLTLQRIRKLAIPPAWRECLDLPDSLRPYSGRRS